MDAIENQTRSIHISDQFVEDCQKAFKTFLEKFKCDDRLKYVEEAGEMSELEKSSFPISFRDLTVHDIDLSENIKGSFLRLHPFLCQTTKKFINEQFTGTQNNGRDYSCHFVDFPTQTSLRKLISSSIGKLACFRAQVIRSQAVHPELIFGTFKCSDCGTIIRDVQQEFIYTRPSICANPQCLNRIKFEILPDESIFVDFQKVRVQETQDEMPRGSVPRSFDVVLRGDTVEAAQPGDICEFIGTLIVVPDIGQMLTPGSRTLEPKPLKSTEGYGDGLTGLRALGVRDLGFRNAFLASHVATVNNKYTQAGDLTDGNELTYDSLKKQMSPQEIERVLEMSQDSKLVAGLCDSLFPSVYGNDEVKRGLLLMMFGGVPKLTKEGTKLRGDLNVCIVGDPSTAKSQFLKRIEAFAPRAVYTSGKASSAAGLTAAVVRDQDSGEFVIEAGALMLANNGICCIDEFDKMEVRDQVAIHEAMEQQTISITKAGVKATLNARTSVLAAANPVGGRYDRSRSLRQNIALSAPIMSRFDLFFVLVDECSESVDRDIANRLLQSQQSQQQQQRQTPPPPYTDEEMRRYITFARCFQPRLTAASVQLMTIEYKKMRDREATSGNKSAWRITVRQLESLARLSEAFARMRYSDVIDVADVAEAARLLHKSIIRIEQPDIDLADITAAAAVDVDVDMGENGGADATAADSAASVTFEEYNRIAAALISHLSAAEEGEGDAGEGRGDLRKSDLVEWYLGSIVDTIANEDDLLRRKHVIEMIIQRLVDKDNILMAVYRTGLIGGSRAAEAEAAAERDLLEEDPIIVLHPNVALM